jgi:hypothetical protein
MGSYSYRLKQIDFDGTTEYSNEVFAEVGAPKNFALMQNYPNPFNPSTTISFALPYRSHIRLEIFNALGQLVRVLCDSELPAGNAQVVWDGRDNKGGDASSGVYFYRLKSDNRTIARKMLLLK